MYMYKTYRYDDIISVTDDNLCSRTLLHSHYSHNFNFFTVVILGFWLCQFNSSVLAFGLCLSSLTKFFV